MININQANKYIHCKYLKYVIIRVNNSTVNLTELFFKPHDKYWQKKKNPNIKIFRKL